jgi:hypothetical protein
MPWNVVFDSGIHTYIVTWCHVQWRERAYCNQDSHRFFWLEAKRFFDKRHRNCQKFYLESLSETLLSKILLLIQTYSSITTLFTSFFTFIKSHDVGIIKKIAFFLLLIIVRIMLSSEIFANKKKWSLIEKNIDLSNVNVLTILLIDVNLVAIDSKRWALS